jgi:hypothetical protein
MIAAGRERVSAVDKRIADYGNAAGGANDGPPVERLARVSKVVYEPDGTVGCSKDPFTMRSAGGGAPSCRARAGATAPPGNDPVEGCAQAVRTIELANAK